MLCAKHLDYKDVAYGRALPIILSGCGTHKHCKLLRVGTICRCRVDTSSLKCALPIYHPHIVTMNEPSPKQSDLQAADSAVISLTSLLKSSFVWAVALQVPINSVHLWTASSALRICPSIQQLQSVMPLLNAANAMAFHHAQTTVYLGGVMH
jgi:hypothetical protein